MLSGNMFREFLIVRRTRVVARLPNVETNFEAMLNAGARLTTVAEVWELHNFTFLADMATGMVWAVPSTCVFELSGRFGNESTR
jgi:hypothetical protein